MREAGAGVAVEPVGDQQHDGTLAQEPPRPQAIEIGECMPYAGPAGPVRHYLGDPLERQVDVAVPQVTRDVGQPCAEDKGIDPVAVVCDRMHEMQKDAAVPAHRAGDVAQDDERWWATARATPLQFDEPARA